MSEFSCPVVKIDKLTPIEGADFIEVAHILGYQSIVRKESFEEGSLAVYLPEQAILPEWLLKELGMWNDALVPGKGKLNGSKGNRIKAVKLRGCLSQGILYQCQRPNSEFCVVHYSSKAFCEGDDASEALGVIKYEPPIPAHLRGQVFEIKYKGKDNVTSFHDDGEQFEAHRYGGLTIKYDIDNWKKFPNLLQEGEPVVFTEKLHGTFACFARVPGLANDDLVDGEIFAYSKGLGAKGFVFKNNEENANNLYQRTLLESISKVREASKDALDDDCKPDQFDVFIFGEIFGQGVQDLTYGQGKPAFRVFDVATRDKKGQVAWLDDLHIDTFCLVYGFDRVPVLYRGPWSKEIADKYVDGKETVSGTEACIREGIVITPQTNRHEHRFGRVILKHVSADYLLRKGQISEFN